ncbi:MULTISPECIES: AAA family ATPase [Enterobacteriaceae]|uniref:AAA family ATPase n=1 Tax=Enterobacteriaceae TaxID=543 RepID=UPI002DB6B806|nr:AAA family ATPase [Leclercia adecarboxylata]MEB6379170.1 AAA family ATPase [Leclercia adecarboxylata]HDC4819996.1 AAA family ATPase [Enterobacter bugandensis]
MKLTELTINGVGGIKSLYVKFRPDMNIICGPNGIGKSTLLLAASFPFLYGYTNKIKRNVTSETGSVSLKIEDNSTIFNPVLDVNVHLPTETIHHFSNNGFDKRKLIKFETLRNFDYKHLEALNADKSLSDDAVSQQINLGVNLHDIKDWFAKRDLFEKVDNGYGPNTIKNIHLARECISILNPQFSYNRVDPKSYDIFVNTPTGVIWYEYLSSGFKSCMSLLLGIIKEIELRYPEQDLYAQEFDGVILIDEIELHLHPEWQARITEALTTTFPSAQFIVTTHSPHVVQNAKSHQIIALVPDNDGAVRVKELPENGLGYSAWTVEEVLLDVMGMESTLSRKLQELLDNFERFVDEEDFDKAKEIYDYLDMALHQNSVLRKSLKISLMSIREREE